MGGFSGNAVVTGGPAAQVGCAATVTTEREIFSVSVDRLFADGAAKCGFIRSHLLHPIGTSIMA